MKQLIEYAIEGDDSKFRIFERALKGEADE
jgi:hypothetical protein